VLTVDEARARILATVAPSGVERVALLDGLRRVAAADVRSAVDVPAWDNSAMDGFAVVASDLADGGATLEVGETIAAGGWPSETLVPGRAAAIMTGAPMPPGADAVVMVENSVRDGGSVTLSDRPEPGQFVRRRGSDVAIGTTVVRTGEVLDAAKLGLLAALGESTVAVARRPRVGLFTTGDEVVAPGMPLQPGQIWSSNNTTLAALVREAGGEPVDLGIVGDALEPTIQRLHAAMDAGCDVVVTTGGVSVGAFDFVKPAFEALGGSLEFWRVRMKPGKPLAFGLAGAVPLLGLPGNPVSCMVNFYQFVWPWIRSAMGDPHPELPVVTARALDRFREKAGREAFVRVRLSMANDGFEARLTGPQGSGLLSSMAGAHGLARVPSDWEGFEIGDKLAVQLIDPEFLSH
jgi:molybdopterin molybdotransferase